MGPLVCGGAILQCSSGAAPSRLVVLPEGRPILPAQGAPAPAANVGDRVPLLHVLPFGMCSAQSNPAVAAATAAALGVPTLAPCIPATPASWVPGDAAVLVGGMPALDQLCILTCAWGGVIRVVFPGQLAVTAT